MSTPENPPPGPPPHPYAASAARSQQNPRRRGLIITAIVLGVAVLAAGVTFLVLNNVNADSRESTSDSSEVAEQTTTPATVTDWPANMATGAIILSGDGGKISAVRSEAPAEGSQPLVPNLAPAADGSEVNRIQLYVDYLCPYCALFEETNSDTLEEALVGGSTVLEVYPLAFLDKYSADSYYSSRATSLMACVASLQPDAAWEAHKLLLDPAFQPEEGTAGHANWTLSQAVADAAGGLDLAAQGCIETERFVPFAGELTEWVFANPVPFAKDPKLAVESTPFAVVNGVPYTGDLADGEAFRKFVQAQGIQLK